MYIVDFFLPPSFVICVRYFSGYDNLFLFNNNNNNNNNNSSNNNLYFTVTHRIFCCGPQFMSSVFLLSPVLAFLLILLEVGRLYHNLFTGQVDLILFFTVTTTSAHICCNPHQLIPIPGAHFVNHIF